ncbi:hypothetical protein LJC56_04035 [Christensenellaceae bacterium OttesenSCG-928-K19]|nr:hypothetical protein [Christensenellaceae bacterium OttesenSCG-928-K19]
MKNKDDVQKKVLLENDKLRFVGFEEQEGREVTIKMFAPDKIWIQTQPYSKKEVPHMKVRIQDGMAGGKELMAFIKEAFRGKTELRFLKLPAAVGDGVEYVHSPSM